MGSSIFHIRFYLFALTLISIYGDLSVGILTGSKCWIGASALAEFSSSDPSRQDRGPREPDHSLLSQIAGMCVSILLMPEFFSVNFITANLE